MDSTVAFTIIGCVLAFVGIMFNLIPKQINQKLMGDLTEEASQVAAGFRVILGSIGITFGIVALSCRNFPPGEAQTLLYALGAGFCVIVAIFVSVKIRGFGELPIPPAIMFAILAIISFYTASGLVIE
tara:strand:+ start:274 stop:657 length:384 start_codon:yes stop_codon:yes gene_type:complete